MLGWACAFVSVFGTRVRPLCTALLLHCRLNLRAPPAARLCRVAAATLSPRCVLRVPVRPVAFRRAAGTLGAVPMATAHSDVEAGAAVDREGAALDLARTQLSAAPPEGLVDAVEGILRDTKDLAPCKGPLRHLHTIAEQGGDAFLAWVRGLDAATLATVKTMLLERVLCVDELHQEHQFPTYLLPSLPSTPWHERTSPYFAPIVARLEAAFPEVRDEFLRVSSAERAAAAGPESGGAGGAGGADTDRLGFAPQPMRCIPRAGTWQVMYLYNYGTRFDVNCERYPVATRVAESVDESRKAPGCAYFSELVPNSAVLPHCDPHNFRVRIHMGIIVPSDGDIGITVGAETRRWEEGKCLMFDDSFDHTTWNNHPTQTRVVFIVDVFHPSLTAAEIRAIRKAYDPAEATAASGPIGEHYTHHNAGIAAAAAARAAPEE